MPVYQYKGVMSNGTIVKNRVEEINRNTLIKRLKRNEIYPISIIQVGRKRKKQQKKKQRRNTINMDGFINGANTAAIDIIRDRGNVTLLDKVRLSLIRSEKITKRDIVIFTQNLYLLKKANFNNVHALNTIIESTENLEFREILQDILSGVEAGENMYVTMEYYENIFPYIYINMIRVGELSGSLTNALEQAVKYLDDSNAINKKLKSILIPNILQFALLLIMLIVGTLVAIPAIQNLFNDIGTKDTLPAITIWFSDFLNFVMENWYVPTMFIIGAVAGIIAYINTPKGRYNFHYFKYTMPIFGKLIYSLDFTRLMRAMLLNLKNGSRIQEALEVSKNVTKNFVMLSMIEAAINNTLIGQSWIEPFESSNLSSSMTTEMLKIGMQTDLSEMLEKLLEYMDIDIDNIMGKIMKVLPEVVYSIVGILLIFFVLVVLVPCINVYMGGFLFSAYGV